MSFSALADDIGRRKEAEMEMKSKIRVTLVKIASVYMMIGLVIGLIMGLSGNHALTSVHSHIGLLGWTTMVITGLVYIVRPSVQTANYLMYIFGCTILDYQL